MAMAGSKSEDILGEKWDRCVADTLIKIGGGLTLGVVFSAIVFKRRQWPVIFGLGSGFGMGYANCQHEFNQPFLVKADKVIVKPKAPAAVPSATSEAQ
ncbi:MICOS complex subunit Mic10-like [Penaeus japonicus]|uniref:MICOS complex subunit Mic10-like n=1 Tax=Penaeus japonicus TaxID=27405 RepID=UPI001C714365|nr:MICOS complex subunit Mic10-like [Penaeus japonicus]